MNELLKAFSPLPFIPPPPLEGEDLGGGGEFGVAFFYNICYI